MKLDWPPYSLYNTLWDLPVVGSPVWQYDGQFIWLPGYYKKKPRAVDNNTLDL